MDEKTIKIIKRISRGIFDYVRGLIYWAIAIPILCVVAIIPTRNMIIANKFHHYFVIEVLTK